MPKKKRCPCGIRNTVVASNLMARSLRPATIGAQRRLVPPACGRAPSVETNFEPRFVWRSVTVGTGVGAGLGWIWHGLGTRSDVSVVSVEVDEQRFKQAIEEKWPGFFRLIHGSIFELYSSLGQFDLIFADSGAGKWDGRDATLAAVKPGGILLMDDMTPPKWHFDKHEQLNAEVRTSLATHPDFVCVELAVATGIIVATKRRNECADTALEPTPTAS
jgi:Methyltransferase domain